MLLLRTYVRGTQGSSGLFSSAPETLGIKPYAQRPSAASPERRPLATSGPHYAARQLRRKEQRFGFSTELRDRPLLLNYSQLFNSEYPTDRFSFIFCVLNCSAARALNPTTSAHEHYRFQHFCLRFPVFRSAQCDFGRALQVCELAIVKLGEAVRLHCAPVSRRC